jgi:hypothetical protein
MRCDLKRSVTWAARDVTLRAWASAVWVVVDDWPMPRPKFRAYLRVIRAKPGFWLGVGLVAAFTTRNVLAEGVVGGLMPMGIGLAIGVLFFPWWRRKVVKEPELYTYGRPELLTDENPAVVGRSEPLSNVRIEGESDR